MTDRPNIVLVVFDTARRDRFGCYGYPRGTTPVVDDFARDSLVFDRMISPAPWTVPSHASLFTGLYPREHGADYPVPVLQRHVDTLAAHLSRAGYHSACVTNNPLIDHATGLAAGFSELVYRPRSGDPRWLALVKSVLGTRDPGAAIANRMVAALLPRLRRPFFLFINYLECHWHYTPPARFQKRFVRGYSWARSTLWRLQNRRRSRQSMWEAVALAGPEELQLYNDLYDAELACADDEFGHLLDILRGAGLFDDSVLLLTSDHGENIGEDGLADHVGSLRQDLIHVPFLARIPGRRPARIAALLQFTDLFAGLSRLVGVVPPEHLEERSRSVDPFALAPGDAGRAHAFAEWSHWGPEKLADLQRLAPHFDFSRIPRGIEAVMNRRYKLVVDLGTGEEGLYNLEADPAETRDVLAAHPVEATELRGALQRWRAAHAVQREVAYSPEERGAVEGRLRELGYI